MEIEGRGVQEVNQSFGGPVSYQPGDHQVKTGCSATAKDYLQLKVEVLRVAAEIAESGHPPDQTEL